ncbi:YdeI/OmpD-associated family protein [Microbacterium sp. CJ88]|uniref:YdeI/OmpD-associated family protein n=1 Tax=Microbacterium sp. CJ88 TaxID=3445672 RepID=UPI003F655104
MDPAQHEGLDIVEFADVAALRAWLASRNAGHPAVWVRLRRARSTVPSVTFHDLLEEGIAAGWSESTRHAYDADSYLQKFGPRRMRGTASPRNRAIAERLAGEGRLTPAGRRALGLPD